MEMIAKEGTGAILYMSQEDERTLGANKLKAYKLQGKRGADTVETNEQDLKPLRLSR